MDEMTPFLKISGLIGEPSRAIMLWHLLDGRMYTAGELAIAANISATAASNHLHKMTEANLLKTQKQGRHRYFTFSSHEIAYAVEALAVISKIEIPTQKKDIQRKSGITYCRTCYDHLAGYIAVEITDTLVRKSCLIQSGTNYELTNEGWNWFTRLGINKENGTHSRRPLTRQCIDWSERKPHLAGHLGTLLLNKMLEDKWVKRVQHTRELIVLPKGKISIYQYLGISI